MISVIIPSYNSGAYLVAALESILSQLDDHDEVLVQDGGSTDETTSIISDLAKRDARLTFVQEEDAGQSDALNRALKRASKDYILWLNADDIVLPGSIASLKSVAREHPDNSDFVYGGHQIINRTGRVISRHTPGEFTKESLLLRGCHIFSGSFIVRRTLLESLGGFSEEFHYCMDLDLLLRIAALPEVKVQRISDTVGALRWHDASKSGGQAKKFVIEGLRVRGRFSSSPKEKALGVLAATIQMTAILTTPLRHSTTYQRLRGRVVR